MAQLDSIRQSIFTLGGVTAILLLVYSLATMVLLMTIGGQPKSAQECFSMLKANRWKGLLRLDVLTILVLPLYFLLFLALYVALYKTNGLLALVAVVIGFAGVTLVLATPSAFSWLALSDKFEAAINDEQQKLFLAAGENLLVSDLWHGSGAMVGGILTQTSLLILSVVMLRNPDFSKLLAWGGILTHGLDLTHILVEPILPKRGAILMFIAGPLYLVWFPLLAANLFRLASVLKF